MKSIIVTALSPKAIDRLKKRAPVDAPREDNPRLQQTALRSFLLSAEDASLIDMALGYYLDDHPVPAMRNLRKRIFATATKEYSNEGSDIHTDGRGIALGKLPPRTDPPTRRGRTAVAK